MTVVRQQNAVNAKLDSIVSILSSIQTTLAYFIKQNRDLKQELSDASHHAREIQRTVSSWDDVMRSVALFVDLGKQHHVERGLLTNTIAGDVENTHTEAKFECIDFAESGVCRFLGPFNMHPVSTCGKDCG